MRMADVHGTLGCLAVAGGSETKHRSYIRWADLRGWSRL